MMADEIRGVLAAYKQIVDASWPGLHPKMGVRSAQWPSRSEAELRSELAEYLAESARSPNRVRVFWKMGPSFVFGGCNEHFARDAGLGSAEEVVGLTDHDRRLPWRHQAAKYRADDKRVADSGKADLDILERQESAEGGITWVRAGKAPIRTAQEVIGVFGMYEVLDQETGRKLFAQRLNRPSAPGAPGAVGT